MASNLNGNAQIAGAALQGHLRNLQSGIPPSFRLGCLESTSTLLRNTLAISVALNCLLTLFSLFSMGARYLGPAIFMASVISLAHAACACMIVGNYVSELASSLGSGRLGGVLRDAAARYGGDAYAHGALFGSTLVAAMLMRLVSNYCGGLSDCVSAATSAVSSAGFSGNLTGGYADLHTGSSSSFDPSAECGASGPVGLVSLLSGLLSWLDAGLAAVLYVKREELLSGTIGVGGGGGSSGQYDEIGAPPRPEGGGFAGDFPTMHV